MNASPKKTAKKVAPKAARPKAAVVVADALRRQIVSGQLKPGDKLVPENVLQAEFTISRPTMREALRLLEAESLITINRGKYGGPRVTAIDLSNIAKQVGVALQIEGTRLEDVWLARTIIEPPAAGLLAARGNEAAMAELEANIEEAREASKGDLLRYAGLSAEFSMLILRHCGNKTLYLLASLIFDIIRQQHEHVTVKTWSRSSVDKLRQNSIESRIFVVEMMRNQKPEAVEAFWREHLLRMRDLVLDAYEGPETIDILTASLDSSLDRASVKRSSSPAQIGQPTEFSGE